MNLNDISQSILTARKEFNEKITLLSEIAKPILFKEFALLFDSVPELECVYWTQYTPSFNDGVLTCQFSMKNYEYELEKFIKWLRTSDIPHNLKTRYEECDDPTAHVYKWS